MKNVPVGEPAASAPPNFAICMYVVPDAIGTRTPASQAAPRPATASDSTVTPATNPMTSRRITSAPPSSWSSNRRAPARTTATRYAVINQMPPGAGREREVGAALHRERPGGGGSLDVERERGRHELHRAAGIGEAVEAHR